MSSGAVAASDPGGGEPKLAAGSDVVMTEAAEEVAAPAAEVKVEGKAPVAEVDAAAAMDVELEGADAAVLSDPLYATESAGMVAEAACGDEPAEGVNGGGGGEERVGAEAVASQSEVEHKPVLAGDVAAPAAQEVEAAGSAASGHAEADPGGENKEMMNGLFHSDKETQNNVPGDVEGSSKIHEDDGAPAADLPDDRSEMLPHTGEQVPGNGDNPSSSEAASPGNIAGQCARYCLPPLDKGGFKVSDLVWGKVKSHPWWPGEIFDPSEASDLALRHQKKGSHLVAYFGDNTFAWCDESQLKPFVTNYSQMEKQNSSDAFVGSVNNALEELSRRILSGMSCSCLPEELCDSGMSYPVDNAGLKDGVTCSAVNRFEILKCFSPQNLLHYIKELALFPGQGGDLLELVIACSQLTSLNRSKGGSELASFLTGSAWVEEGMDTSTQSVMVEDAVIDEVHPTPDKPKRGRGRPQKQKPESDQEVVDKKGSSNLNSDITYHNPMERQMGMEFDDFDYLDNKRKRSLDSFEDSEKMPTPTVGSSFKIGECIRRAASQLTGSSSIVKAQNDLAVHKNTAEGENGEFDVSSDDAVDELTVLNRAKKRRMYRNNTADPKELLSQLCTASTEPMNGHSFSAMIISYFSDYRNYVVSTATEASIVEKGASRRGRKRKVLPSPEVETTDHMQDSYWSGLSLHNHPIHNLTKEGANTRLRRRRRSSRQAYVPSSELGALGPKKPIQVIERSIIHVDEKMVDELKPTALVLSFGRSADLPSKMDLIKMFSRYGPLKETETEVHKETNTVKVVFKKRIDAERAFSFAGKYGSLGPSLRSYRLVNMPFSLNTSEANNPGTQPEDCGLEVPGPSEPKVPMDAMQIDQNDNGEKTEFVGDPSVEQVETAKRTSQVEAADKALMDPVDMVEKTGKLDAELAGHVDQFGTGAQAESVAEGSSEQVNTVEQEASVERTSEITQSGAATGASNGGMIAKILIGEAPNQALIDDVANTMQMEVDSEAQTEDTVMQTLHIDATNEESAQIVSDNMQVDLVAAIPVQGHISGDSTIFEVAAQMPTTAQADSEADTANEKPLEQDASEQIVGSEDKKLVSGEVPCCSKLEAETLNAEPVGQDTVEQVNAQVESKTVVEVSGEQTCSIEQTVQVEAVTEGSGGHIEVGRLTPEDEYTADPTTEHSVMAEETLESKIEVAVEGNVENNAAVAGLVAETAEEQTMVEAPADNIENKATAKALAGETREGEIAVDAPNENSENKATAEALAGDTRAVEITVGAQDVKAENKATAELITGEKAEAESAVEAPHEETGAAEETGTTGESVEDVKALDEKTTTDEMIAKDAAVVTPVEKTTTSEKTVDDTMVETPDGEITEVKTAVEDAAVETPDRKITEVGRAVEGVMVDTPDGKPTEAQIDNTTVEAPVEESSTDEKTVEDAMDVTLDGRTTEAEKTMEDGMVKTPEGKSPELDKTVEGATIEASGDAKSSAAEKTIDDITVEASGVRAGASEQTS